MGLLEESGYPDNKEEIYVLNPHLFSKMEYIVRIEPDEMLPKNSEFERLIAERLYSLLRQDPLIEPEALVRGLLYASYPQSADRFLAKNTQAQTVQNVMGKPASLPSLPSNVTGI